MEQIESLEQFWNHIGYYRCVVRQVMYAAYFEDPISRQTTSNETILLVNEDIGFKHAICGCNKVAQSQFNSQANSRLFLVVLRDEWASTTVDVGDVVNVIGKFVPVSFINETPESKSNIFGSIKQPFPAEWDSIDWNNVMFYCIFSCRGSSQTEDLLITHPDVLLTGTRVSSSFSCLRKTVLDAKVRSPSTRSRLPLIQGQIAHDLFEYAVRRLYSSDSSFVTEEGLMERASLLIKGKVYELFESHLIEADVQPELLDLIPKIVEWVASHSGISNSGHQPIMRIKSVLGIEEKFWSVMYGLKGQIDVSLNASFDVKNSNSIGQVVPFELKTGKGREQNSHMAQVLLYALAMSERYGVDVPDALLCYIKGQQTKRISVRFSDVRNIILKRNELASFSLNSKSTLPSKEIDKSGVGDIEDFWGSESCLRLPPTLKGGSKECKWCDHLSACSVLSVSMGGTVNETEPNNSRKLLMEGKKYVRQWMNLIEQEECESSRSIKDIWTAPVNNRVEIGVCIRSLVVDCQLEGKDFRSVDGEIVPNDLMPWTSADSIMVKFMSDLDDVPAMFKDSQFSIGDMIVVSLDTTASSSTTMDWSKFPLIAVSQGYMHSISEKGISVSLDQPLIVPPRMESRADRNEFDLSDTVWRIDKLESASSWALARGNILTLCESLVNLPQSGASKKRMESSLLDVVDKQRLLSLVVELADPIVSLEDTKMARLPTDIKRDLRNLNKDQREAISRALNACDYTLILGMPGTGKTTVIALLIRALVALNQTVLLVSHTHTAVDNVLLKLCKKGNQSVPFLRLGRKQNIHPKIVPFCLQEGDDVTVDSVSLIVDSHRVMGCTCLGINNPIIGGLKQPFDVCIVDEASQIAEPHIIGPLLRAKSFVLVGDHYQLPPLVRNREARMGGAAVSLFKRLSEAHPEAVVLLRYQYRMNSDVLVLPNTLIYNGELMCGNREVSEGALPLVNWNSSEVLETPWLPRLLDPAQGVCFLDTDSLPARENQTNKRSVTNSIECDLAVKITTAFIHCGVPEDDIGIISPYRAQIRLISQQISHVFPFAEVCTVDKFQGRDKSVIVLSFVRSNPEGNIGSLLNDCRRLNVAFSRAKHKIVLIGSKTTLENSSSSHLKQLISIVIEKNWFINTDYKYERRDNVITKTRIVVHEESAVNVINDQEIHQNLNTSIISQSELADTVRQGIRESLIASKKNKRGKSKKAHLVQAKMDMFGLVAWNPHVTPKKLKPKGNPRKRASQQVAAAISSQISSQSPSGSTHDAVSYKKRTERKEAKPVRVFLKKLKYMDGPIAPMNTLRPSL